MPIKEIFKDLFLQEKPAEMLVFLKKGDEPNYATEVSKGVDCTYSHTIKVLDQFEELELVTFRKEGRIKLIELTEDGEEIAHDLEGLVRKFERKAQENQKESDKKSEESSEEKDDESSGNESSGNESSEKD